MVKRALLKKNPELGELKASIINGLVMMIPTIAIQIFNLYVFNMDEISGKWFFLSVVLTIIVCLMWDIGETVMAITQIVGKVSYILGKLFLIIPGLAGTVLCICTQITGWFVFVMFLYLIPVIIMPILGLYRFIARKIFY